MWLHHGSDPRDVGMDDRVLEDLWKVFYFSGLSAKTSSMTNYFAGTINIPNLALPESAICSGLTGLLFSGLISVFVSLLSERSADL